MVAIPAPVAVQTPPVAVMDAVPPAELVHVPPATVSVRVAELPWHSSSIPDMGPGDGLTVAILVMLHPVVVLVNAMVVVPPAIPANIPDVEPMVATVGRLLVQVPVPDASAKVAVCPVQTVAGPLMPAGSGFTVTATVAEQPATV